MATATVPPYGDRTHLIPPTTLRRLIQGWLEEDCPNFDVGGYIVGEEVMKATLLAKSPGIVAGRPFFDEVFRQLDCTSKQFLTRLRKVGYQGVLAGTRKTTPGFRLVEKYGMIIGGCDPHRYDLSSTTMLKDNHVMAFNGAIDQAIHRAKEVGGFSTKVEVECRVYTEAMTAAMAGADIIMLDNFPLGDIPPTASWVKDMPGVLVEVSGGVTEKNIESYAIEGE
ncbi:MAG: hypothetical protein M1823_006067 [Watsoniomyces obsoletus]|nr:MAG: hypothetical protein M1823_006067 [Watsoniomyces obsoletus]